MFYYYSVFTENVIMFAIKCCEILNNIYDGTIKFITFVLETHNQF